MDPKLTHSGCASYYVYERARETLTQPGVFLSVMWGRTPVHLPNFYSQTRSAAGMYAPEGFGRVRGGRELKRWAFLVFTFHPLKKFILLKNPFTFPEISYNTVPGVHLLIHLKNTYWPFNYLLNTIADTGQRISAQVELGDGGKAVTFTQWQWF